MLRAVSLFSNVGIAETYFADLDIHVAVANELVPQRAEFYRHLYPKTNMIVGDITDAKIYSQIKICLRKKDVDGIGRKHVEMYTGFSRKPNTGCKKRSNLLLC